MRIIIEQVEGMQEDWQGAAVLVEQALAIMSDMWELGENEEVGVLLCDDKHIRELNYAYRQKDSATDVISFALNDGEERSKQRPDQNMLGDIVISVETACRQATEYGHSLEREVAFLSVHGMLHLLGYDHQQEEERREMRTEEEAVLQRLGLTREDKADGER